MINIGAKDTRSVTGSNATLLENCSGLNPWEFGSFRLKEELVKNETVDVPEKDSLGVRYLASLLEQRQVVHYQGNEEEEELFKIPFLTKKGLHLTSWEGVYGHSKTFLIIYKHLEVQYS